MGCERVQPLWDPSLISSHKPGSGSFAKASSIKNTNSNDMLLYRTHVTSSCFVANVKSSHCIALHFVWKKNQNAVPKLNNLMNGDAISSSFLISWMLSASSTFALIPQGEDLELLMDAHLSSIAKNADSAAIMKIIVSMWYSVVVGCHPHVAIL